MREIKFSMVMTQNDFIIFNECIGCGHTCCEKITSEQMVRYCKDDDSVQDIFPEMSAANREQLFLNCYCDECYKRLYPEECHAA
jgi:hypothetical protein